MSAPVPVFVNAPVPESTPESVMSCGRFVASAALTLTVFVSASGCDVDQSAVAPSVPPERLMAVVKPLMPFLTMPPEPM